MSESVIACFSPIAVWIRTAIYFVVMVTAWALVLLYPRPPHPAAYALGTKAFIGLGMVCTVFAVWIMASLVWQMFRHDGKAIWIENSQLRFIDTLGMNVVKSLAAADIRDLSIKDFLLHPPQIVIKMKYGWSGDISTGLLADSAEAVRARLTQALPLPKTDSP
ncbi:MAG TPA: hypothetical protein VHX92_04820 [Rhizomicrobium sp.]|jgi:hypothetical protein|nr:hypothetical protein [Rhizomicrobium sp.]